MKLTSHSIKIFCQYFFILLYWVFSSNFHFTIVVTRLKNCNKILVRYPVLVILSKRKLRVLGSASNSVLRISPIFSTSNSIGFRPQFHGSVQDLSSCALVKEKKTPIKKLKHKLKSAMSRRNILHSDNTGVDQVWVSFWNRFGVSCGALFQNYISVYASCHQSFKWTCKLYFPSKCDFRKSFRNWYHK